MPDTRGGHHGNIAYLFEDNGFDASPTDSTFKGFGGNATLDTFDGSHQAVRVFNTDRYAAEIIEQTFDGAWSITTEGFTEPPWWLECLFGDPTTTNPAGSQYVHTYDLANNNDPTSIRIFMPTDGFTNYKYIGGCVIASITVDQSSDGSPEITLNGAYASEPETSSSLSPSVPNFEETSFTNRDAELKVGGNTVGKAQSTTVTLESNTELIGEIGSENAVDFTPRTWAPSVDWDKILTVGQTVDPLDRWKNFTSAALELIYDNGETGDNKYTVDINVSSSVPNEWSESGRNDPEADLMEEMSEMGTDVTVELTVDVAAPP